MRLAILSGGRGWHVQDLLRAAAELGYPLDVLDFRALAAGVGLGTSIEPLAGYSAALVRTIPAGSLEQIIVRMDWLHAAQQRGVRVVNPPRCVEMCVDKYLASVRLAAAGLPTPPVHVAQRAEEAMHGFERLGGDVVLKPLFGAEGHGLQRISDPELAWRTFRVLEHTAQVIYQQRFVPHPGYDLRVFVIGGKVAATMRRIATRDWRTNVAQGARAEAATIDDHIAEYALRAAAAVQAEIAGIDLLPDRSGQWWVLEVNAVPGWKALATACGIDMARRVLQYLVEP